MIAVLILAAFGLSVLWAGSELGRERPRHGHIMAAVSLLIILAVLAGGALTGGGL